jgi:hypothetical protein
MKALSTRPPSGDRQGVLSLPKLHLELWVARRRNQARLSRLLRRIYRVARRITEEGGGSGPWVYLVDPDPANARTTRLRILLGLRPDEDLWIELVYYPSRVRMRKIIAQIWKHPVVMANAQALDALLSNRKTGYQATIAYAALKAV